MKLGFVVPDSLTAPFPFSCAGSATILPRNSESWEPIRHMQRRWRLVTGQAGLMSRPSAAARTFGMVRRYPCRLMDSPAVIRTSQFDPGLGERSAIDSV